MRAIGTNGAVAATLAAFALAALRAQAPAGEPFQQLTGGHRLRVVAVAGCTAQAVAVVWPHAAATTAQAADAAADTVAEPLARAHLVAALRAQQSGAVLPKGAMRSVEVGEACTVFTAVWPDAQPEGAAAWFGALLRAPDPVAQQDQLARACAQQALAADDADWLFPGDVLLGRARRALAVGGGVHGSPTYLQRLSPADCAIAVTEPPCAPLCVCVVGSDLGVPALAAALERVSPRGDAVRAVAASSTPRPPAGPDIVTHPRVDAAYVAVVARAPAPGPDALPFALGVAVLRSRASVRFRDYRGNEAMARTPFVTCEVLLGEPTVMLCRRGRSPEPAQPRAELEALLAELGQQPPDDREVGLAADALLAEWAVPPWSRAQVATFVEAPASLLPRARTLALLLHHGIGDDAVRGLGALTGAAVARQLAATLAPERLWWGGLVPAARPPVLGR